MSHRVGARFLAESENWSAFERESAAAPEAIPSAHVTAPLIECVLLHMRAAEVAEFCRWRDGLPEASCDSLI